jgi:alkylresorcinol/alkylpyrone synthase
VTGLSLAGRLAKARPGSVVLFVTIELCTLAFRLDELTKANIVATALFGDGAAACVVRAGSDSVWRIEGAGEHTWPSTLDIMGWNVDPLGFGVIFAQAIPPFVRRNLGPAADAMLGRIGLDRDDVGRFVCHPGGAKVVEALEGALGLGQGALDVEREVLADFGNMSAPTVLFVLERVLQGEPPGRLFLSSLGPGFTASGLSLVRA